ncbi:MAG: hypothetical protein IJS51_10630 [Treponema sp.]|nr:hypothetical protein [Treponema sp.]
MLIHTGLGRGTQPDCPRAQAECRRQPRRSFARFCPPHMRNGNGKSGAKERTPLRKLSVCVCRFSGSVNSFKTQTASSDDIERFRKGGRDWEPRFFIANAAPLLCAFLFTDCLAEGLVEKFRFTKKALRARMGGTDTEVFL